LPFFFNARFFVLSAHPLLLGGALEVQSKQPFEDLLAGNGTYCKAEAVVFGEGFEFVEIVAQVDIVIRGRSKIHKLNFASTPFIQHQLFVCLLP